MLTRVDKWTILILVRPWQVLQLQITEEFFIFLIVVDSDGLMAITKFDLYKTKREGYLEWLGIQTFYIVNEKKKG